MFKKITFLVLMSVISISFVFSSGLWLEKRETNYKPGEIVPTPVPIEIVKRVVMDYDVFSHQEGEPCEDMWGQYVDCELYPVYDENNIPIEYLVLAYREKSERLGMFEMLEKRKPYIYELMKLDNEMAKLDNEMAKLEREGEYLYYENKYSDITKEMEEIRIKMNDNHEYCGYGWGYISGIYELPPQISEFHNGCIPILFYYFFKALDEVKEKYNTNDVEFVCFRTFGSLGSRGWEFRAGDKWLFVTTYLEEKLGEPRWHIRIKEITPELKSLWIEEYNENYKELWKEYETDDMQGMINKTNDSIAFHSKKIV